MDSLSASLNTATVWIPNLLAVLITRQAISPRLAIKTLEMGVIWRLVLLAVGVKSGLHFEWRYRKGLESRERRETRKPEP